MKSKKGLLAGFIAMFFYALESVTIQKELSQTKPEVTTAYFYLWATILVVAVGIPVGLWLKWIVFSPGISYRWHAFVVVCILVEVVADYCVFLAYHENISVATVATMIGFFPIFAVLLECLWSWHSPSLRQLAGCALVPVAIYLTKPSF